MDSEEKQEVLDLIEKPLLQAECEVAQLLLSRYKKNVTLRLFVYCKDGVGLDKCRELSRLVGDLIEETELFPLGYRLEVSSPGLDRRLKSLIDYKYRVGETVRMSFVDPKRKKVKAKIIGLDGDRIEFENEQGSFVVPVDELEESRIIF